MNPPPHPHKIADKCLNAVPITFTSKRAWQPIPGTEISLKQTPPAVARILYATYHKYSITKLEKRAYVAG